MILLHLILFCLTVAAAYNQNFSSELHDESDLLVRKARWLPLIYPSSHPARLKFIAGFGIPVDDLNIESITTGYVFKAQYYLPNRAKQLRVKDVHGITERQLSDNATLFQQTMQKTDQELGIPPNLMEETSHALSGYRWAIYKSFETMAIRMNLNGRQCVLKSICESSAAPFDERNGLLGELLHILLTPSSSMDALSEHTDNDYLQAERFGHAGANCDQVYANCAKSLLAHFSDVHHLGSEFLKMLG
ncbi:PREDICTED: uncharacterized protein LOC108612366 [Drosophila arizonae]|uniref:Uncharacterized protein LOC108612366 n=1 Tax=Drosophila arizonae TaxID=7263 RepID=A0ABM1P0J7_DROAR|nr:PREDICTED: uncharacterized protein LOC108612366 [Drosophila arizonae]